MGVTYGKLRQILIDRKIQWKDIHKKADISNGTIAKINKDEYVKLDILERIIIYLNTNQPTNKQLDIGDVVEIKKTP